MSSSSDIVAARIRVRCKPPGGVLRTDNPQSLLHTHRTFQRLVGRALSKVIEPEDEGARHLATFDLSECQAIDPGAVLLLMYAGRELRGLGWEVFISQQKAQSAAYAAVLKHLQHFSAPKSERSSIAPEPGSYPLRGVHNRDDMVSELEEWAQCVAESAEADEEAMALWTTHVSEVATNGFQHGVTGLHRRMGPVLLAGMASRQVGGTQLAVLDTGSGIPAVLRPTLGPAFVTRHDGHVIAEACRAGVTSRCDRSNQGLGLYFLTEAVKTAGGTLQILSGNGLSHVAKKRMHCREVRANALQDQTLAGTLTVITLKGTKWRS